ncbi:hypothetical protein ACP70R_015708 [Stipagrostis hirtigluma subsp. patula]
MGEVSGSPSRRPGHHGDSPSRGPLDAGSSAAGGKKALAPSSSRRPGQGGGSPSRGPLDAGSSAGGGKKPLPPSSSPRPGQGEGSPSRGPLDAGSSAAGGKKHLPPSSSPRPGQCGGSPSRGPLNAGPSSSRRNLHLPPSSSRGERRRFKISEIPSHVMILEIASDDEGSAVPGASIPGGEQTAIQMKPRREVAPSAGKRRQVEEPAGSKKKQKTRINMSPVAQELRSKLDDLHLKLFDLEKGLMGCEETFKPNVDQLHRTFAPKIKELKKQVKKFHGPAKLCN